MNFTKLLQEVCCFPPEKTIILIVKWFAKLISYASGHSKLGDLREMAVSMTEILSDLRASFREGRWQIGIPPSKQRTARHGVSALPLIMDDCISRRKRLGILPRNKISESNVIRC